MSDDVSGTARSTRGPQFDPAAIARESRVERLVRKQAEVRDKLDARFKDSPIPAVIQITRTEFEALNWRPPVDDGEPTRLMEPFEPEPWLQTR